jgi:hypothetical protein
MTIADPNQSYSTADRRMMRVIYHADLSDAYSGEEYWLRALGREYQLVPHTLEGTVKLIEVRLGGGIEVGVSAPNDDASKPDLCRLSLPR